MEELREKICPLMSIAERKRTSCLEKNCTFWTGESEEFSDCAFLLLEATADLLLESVNNIGRDLEAIKRQK